MNHPNTKEEYDKEWERFESEMGKIESYPPPRPTMNKVRKNVVIISIGSFIWGSLLTLAIGGTIVLNLLERETSIQPFVTCEFVLNGEKYRTRNIPCIFTAYPNLLDK